MLMSLVRCWDGETRVSAVIWQHLRSIISWHGLCPATSTLAAQDVAWDRARRFPDGCRRRSATSHYSASNCSSPEVRREDLRRDVGEVAGVEESGRHGSTRRV